MTEVYINEEGKLMAKCPNSLNDVNVWVRCQTCVFFKKCFDDKRIQELYKEALSKTISHTPNS